MLERVWGSNLVCVSLHASRHVYPSGHACEKCTQLSQVKPGTKASSACPNCFEMDLPSVPAFSPCSAVTVCIDPDGKHQIKVH